MKQIKTDGKSFFNQSVDAVLLSLLSSANGLSDNETKRRLAQYGPNLITPPKVNWLKRLVEPFASVFVVVLLFAIVFSLLTHELLDASIIGLVVIANALIYYFQQASVSRVLASLREQDAKTVRVRREGKLSDVPAAEVVPGDIVLLYEGMKIPADGRLIKASQLAIDEAVLTGESLPVYKQEAVISGQAEIYEQRNMAFQGTFVQSGSGEMVITHTGDSTEFGSISVLVGKTKIDKSPIEKKVDKLTRQLIVAVLVIGAALFGLALIRGIGAEEGVRFSISLVVSAVPEGLPIALTVVLFLSAKRMAKHNALVKKISAIETLGAVTVVATDKTGTLTKNQLSVAEQYAAGSDESLFKKGVYRSINDDGQDSLDFILGRQFGRPKEPAKFEAQFPFNQDLRVSGSVWKVNGKLILYLKGAPELILGKKPAKELSEALQQFTHEGYRTIAFGYKTLDRVPSKLSGALLENLKPAGIIGLADPMREGIAAAVEEAKSAGIKVVMMTGDHAATAINIGRQAGIAEAATEATEGRVLTRMPLAKVRQLVGSVKVFARVLPEHKYRLVQAVRGQQITAMTGDGINDIPALVEANVGIAMGYGTDAAKEAADIVLLDNNFKSIVTAIRYGRAVISNITKMIFYLLSTNLGEAVTMFSALILNLPLPVTAAQILWLNLVTDGFTVLPLGLSRPEPQQMKQPPRSPKAPLLNFVMVSRFIVIGLVVGGVSLWVFNSNLHKGYLYAQTLTFTVLAIAQLANALNANFEHRSWIFNFIKPNWALWGGLTLALLVQALVLFTPAKSLLGLEAAAVSEFIMPCLIATIAVLLAGDLHKLITKLSSKVR